MYFFVKTLPSISPLPHSLSLWGNWGVQTEMPCAAASRGSNTGNKQYIVHIRIKQHLGVIVQPFISIVLFPFRSVQC